MHPAIEHDWQWRENTAFNGLMELYEGDRMLAWIQKRPNYCDRGHWQLNVEGVTDLDDADRFPRYYMRLEVAKAETIAFLAWRLHKWRASP